MHFVPQNGTRTNNPANSIPLAQFIRYSLPSSKPEESAKGVKNAWVISVLKQQNR